MTRDPNAGSIVEEAGGNAGKPLRMTVDHVPYLGGTKLLYLGEATQQVAHMRAVTMRRGGTLLQQGIDCREDVLSDLVEEAEAVLCTSHVGTARIEAFCADAGKPWIKLRAASLESYVAALRSIRRGVQPTRSKPGIRRPAWRLMNAEGRRGVEAGNQPHMQNRHEQVVDFPW